MDKRLLRNLKLTRIADNTDPLNSDRRIARECLKLGKHTEAERTQKRVLRLKDVDFIPGTSLVVFQTTLIGHRWEAESRQGDSPIILYASLSSRIWLASASRMKAHASCRSRDAVGRSSRPKLVDLFHSSPSRYDRCKATL